MVVASDWGCFGPLGHGFQGPRMSLGIVVAWVGSGLSSVFIGFNGSRESGFYITTFRLQGSGSREC